MAKFVPGAVSTVGITGSFFTQLATQTASSGVAQALGQVWQGSGQSFFGQAGQALGGALAGSAVNIALNSAFNTAVPGPQGFSLNSGANILASTITPYVTSSVSAGINQNIQKSLQNAGPFGPVLSGIGTGLVNQATQGITNAIFGAATPGSGTNIKMFPGADDSDPSSSYKDNLYTLTDIVFSLKPAYQGPQSEGDAQAINSPTTGTTVGVGEVAGAGNMPSGPGSSATDPMAPVANQVRAKAMGDGQAPLRTDGPLWPGDGDSQAPLRPDGPLWAAGGDGGGAPRVAPSSTLTGDPYNQGGIFTEDYDPTVAQTSGTRQAGYQRKLNLVGIDPSNVRTVILRSNGSGASSSYIGYIDKYGNRQEWPTRQEPTSSPTQPSLW